MQAKDCVGSLREAAVLATIAYRLCCRPSRDLR